MGGGAYVWGMHSVVKMGAERPGSGSSLKIGNGSVWHMNAPGMGAGACVWEHLRVAMGGHRSIWPLTMFTLGLLLQLGSSFTNSKRFTIFTWLHWPFLCSMSPNISFHTIQNVLPYFSLYFFPNSPLFFASSPLPRLPPCQPEEWSGLIHDLWDAPIDSTDHPTDSTLHWPTSQGGRDRWRYATPPSRAT